MRTWRRLQDRPRLLERVYRATRRAVGALAPLFDRIDPARADRWLARAERASKTRLFDCRMCGQCTLHATGMTCPMTCPKTLRNGPCGGVRADGSCEVDASRRCVWVDAVERALRMQEGLSGLSQLQAPLDGRLAGSSAWLNQLRSDRAATDVASAAAAGG